MNTETVIGMYLFNIEKYKGCTVNFSQIKMKKRIDIIADEYGNSFSTVFVEV